MTLRLIRLPTDLVPLGEMVAESFQYPENGEWSVQIEERDQIVDMMKNLRRLWPLVRVIQALSPPLRDLFRGYIWEEDGRVVGTTIVQRRGSTSIWIIGTVGVLPAYRRRGIARKLVEASLGLIRERGGDRAILGVIDGNLPAYALYEKLGFEHFSGDVEFHTTPEKTISKPTLPQGYTQSLLDLFDWQPRYELENRIAPENVRRYEPVEVGRFRQPAMMRLLLPVITFAQGTREEEVVVHTAAEGIVVGRGRSSIPTRGKGFSTIGVRLDPAHGELAPYLVGYLLHRAATLCPGRRVELIASRWMEPVIAAAEAAGFRRRMEYCRMGIAL